MSIKCDLNGCKGDMSILYDREGIAYYYCNLCDNKRSKYEIEQEDQQTSTNEERKTETPMVINESMQKLKSIFENDIMGYNDLKSMLIDIVDLQLKDRLDKPSHTLLIGNAGTCKTFFFECMAKALPKPIFEIIDSSHLSGTGLLSYLKDTNKNNSLLFIVMDELDKMDTIQQKKLLSGIESGILKERKYKRYTELDISNILFFATANEKSKIYNPLLTRFTVLELPDYSYQEYRTITDNWIKDKCNNSYVDLCKCLFPTNSPTQRIHIRTIKRLVDLSQCDPLKLSQYLKVIDKYN